MLSEEVLEIFTRAAAAARSLEHTHVAPVHVLMALLRAQGTLDAAVFSEHGLTLTGVRMWTRPNLESGTADSPMPLTKAMEDLQMRAMLRARTHGNETNRRDVVFSLLKQAHEDVEFAARAANTTCAQLLVAYMRACQLEDELSPLADVDGDEDQVAPTPAFESETFWFDMTAEVAHRSQIRAVGRDRELDRVLHVLSRKKKNNPVLVGDPGVGKTAIVDALAVKLTSPECPPQLAGRRLYRLDAGALIAGARMRGDLEGRLQRVISVAKEKRHIIFVDEIHALMSVGSESTQTISVADMLKTELSGGGLTIVGATTNAEYRKRIAVDAALARRFTTVHVGELDVSQVEQILRDVAHEYEAHHGVSFSKEALRAVATFSHKHMHEGANPDKALDLLDETGARMAARSNQTSQRPVVAEGDVAATVSALTGAPVPSLKVVDAGGLANLPQELAARVLGQDDAVDKAAKAVRRRRSGLSGVMKPVTLLFAGSTGVGKTELARALADALFNSSGDPQGRGELIKFDMGEFSQPHTVARLLGSPPGYQGHTQGGQLTERVRRNPASVILFDEIEKAHPEVFDALLGVMEEGCMRDSAGNEVNFRDTVIVFTTNAGAATKTVSGFAAPAGRAASKVRDALASTFRPEFLNRLDEVVVFKSLDSELATVLVDRAVDRVVAAAEREGIRLTVAAEVREHLGRAGISADTGARELQRVVERDLVDEVSEALFAAKGAQISSVSANLTAAGAVSVKVHLKRAKAVKLEAAVVVDEAAQVPA